MHLTEHSANAVTRIFAEAHADGRDMLYEHEVYGILDAVGITCPGYVFIRDPQEITEELLRGFDRELMVKAVSPDIIHKKKLGGVRHITIYDPLFVRYVVQQMRDEVIAKYPGDTPPRIAGFLLAEFIPFSESLGHELLLGAKEDPAFGPVLTLSKGGDDAEFFAAYYDPANLFLPHLSYENALAFMNTLKIKHKFDEIGHTEYAGYIAKAASSISALLEAFSPLRESPYHIRSMDINPIVIAKDGRFVAVDGYVSFIKAPSAASEVYTPSLGNMDGFFHPKGIAVLGVTSQPGKNSMAKEIVRLLHDMGRTDVYCINPKGGTAEINGTEYPLYTHMDEFPPVDLAVYAAPAQHIPLFFANIRRHVPKAVVLIPGIPSELDYGEFVRRIRASIPPGVRVVGPNCVGIMYGPGVDKGVNTLFIEEERLKVRVSRLSNTALLSQSGGVAITLLDKLMNSPIFKSIVSFGNKLDVNIPDLIAYFDTDESIDVIALYVEGFDPLEGRAFYELARSIRKPLLVYKGGKTAQGAIAAASHTAAIAGEYDVLQAACSQAGIILLDDIKMFYDSIKAFSLLSKKRLCGRRMAAVLNAGFEATILSDELGSLIPATLRPETMAKLQELNSHGLVDTRTSILDVTPMTDDVRYGRFIEALLQDENVDSLVVGVVPHVDNIKSTPDTCHDPESLANIVADIFARYNKPLVVSVNAGEYYREFVAIMEEAGIPVYGNIRSAARSLETYVDWHLEKAK